MDPETLRKIIQQNLLLKMQSDAIDHRTPADVFITHGWTGGYSSSGPVPMGSEPTAMQTHGWSAPDDQTRPAGLRGRDINEYSVTSGAADPVVQSVLPVRYGQTPQPASPAYADIMFMMGRR